MALSNLKPQSVVPQEKVCTIPKVRNESPEQLMRRECFDFAALEDDLNTIRAVSDVLDYTGEFCQGKGERLTIIAAGLGEALKVAHDRMARAIEA